MQPDGQIYFDDPELIPDEDRERLRKAELATLLNERRAELEDRNEALKRLEQHDRD